LNEKKERRIFSWAKDITIEVHGKTLNRFASVCPRVSSERAFDNEVLLESLSFPFERIKYFGPAKLSWEFVSKSPIYRPLMTITNSIKRYNCWQIFWKLSTGNRLQYLCNRLHSYNLKGHDFLIWISGVSLLVIDYRHMVIDYIFKIQIQNPFQQLFFIIPFW